MTKKTGESLGGGGNNPETTDEWGEFGTGARGTFVMGPDGKMIPKEQLDAAEEAHGRAEWYKAHPDVQQAKEKWISKGWAHMTHWYKEHPDEIDELISPDSKHDKRYYLKQQEEDPRTIGYLVAGYLARKARGTNSGEQTPQPDVNPNVGTKPEDETKPGEGDDGRKPELPDPAIGETPQLPDPTKIEIGDVKIEGVKQIEQKFNEADEKELELVKEELAKIQPDLAELYAKNRRLIVGSENRAKFRERQGKYNDILERYLHLKVKENVENCRKELSEDLQKEIDTKISEIKNKLADFSQSEIGGPYRTQEEVDAERTKLVEEATTEIQEWYDKQYADIKTKVNTEFLEELIKQKTDLEKATTDALDKGSFCRKFVNKVLNNRILKGALVAASVAGLAATGVGIATGLAAGTLAVGFNLTGAGFAAGAAKGGFGGAFMSRQDSRASRVRGFASREDIIKQIGEMNVTNENVDTKNVSSWLMEQYSQANRQDRSSNLKRTAVASGIGALLGGLASGFHFDKTINKDESYTGVVDHEPIEVKPQFGAENVNVSPNHGYLQIFEQVGGDPSNSTQWNEAFKITQQIAQKYGVTSDMGKGIISPNGLPEILPGSPSTWDTTSQQFLNEVLNAWASKGCIPSIQTGGNPIMGVIEKIVPVTIKNSIIGYLTRSTAYMAGAAIGGAIGGARAANRAPQSPEVNVASVDDAVVESYVGPLSNLLGEDYPEEVRRRVIVAELARELYPESSNNGGDDPEAVLANLSDEQRNHLEALYERIAREAAERRARDEANAASGTNTTAPSSENQQ